MLKAASEAHQAEVFNFVLSRKGIMPRTAYRYAIGKMPPERRAEAIKSNGGRKTKGGFYLKYGFLSLTDDELRLYAMRKDLEISLETNG
jgi:hypothetical protein